MHVEKQQRHGVFSRIQLHGNLFGAFHTSHFLMRIRLIAVHKHPQAAAVFQRKRVGSGFLHFNPRSRHRAKQSGIHAKLRPGYLSICFVGMGQAPDGRLTPKRCFSAFFRIAARSLRLTRFCPQRSIRFKGHYIVIHVSIRDIQRKRPSIQPVHQLPALGIPHPYSPFAYCLF